MKKFLCFAMVVSLSISLTSCNGWWLYRLVAVMMGVDPYTSILSNAIVASVDSALYSEMPVVVPPQNDEQKRPNPPGEIVGPPISSEPGGGGEQQEEKGSSFADIFTAPSFTLGPSISFLGGDKEESEKFPARPGFQLGAIWQVPLTAGLNLEPGLLYGNRGVGYKSEESGYYEPGVPGGSYGYSYGQKKKLHYLELPVFVSGNIMNGLDLFGGPQVAFLLGAKVVNESNGETTSTEKGTKGLNKVDLGLAAGARYEIPNTFFSVSLGYYHGLSNLSSGSEYGGGYDEPKYFTRAARLGINYNFPAARSHATSGSGKKNGFKSWVSK